MIPVKLGRSVVGRGGRINSPPPNKSKPKKPQKTSSQTEAAELGLRLLIRDELSENDIVRLSEDLSMWVRGRLQSGGFSDVEDFMIKHKDHMTHSMKDMVTIEIKLKGMK